MNEKYKINTPNVVHESLDNEVVLIHLERGTFYNFGKTGIDIWEGIVKGYSKDQLVAFLLSSYEGDRSGIQDAVNHFVAQLCQEELIVLDSTESNTSETSLESLIPATNKLPFESPVLEKYTDMQDLLLLDPIHQVSEAGWPNVSNGNKV